MMSVVFNCSKSYVHQRVESVAVKAGYLLSHRVCSAGHTCLDMNTGNRTSKASLFEQLDFIEYMSRYYPKFQKEVRKMRAIMKNLRSNGGKPSAHHVKRIEGEELIQSTFQFLTQSYEKVMRKYNLMELVELAGEDELVLYPMNANPEDSLGNKILASQLLQRHLYNDENDTLEDPEIFMLDAGFLSVENEQKVVYNISDVEAANEHQIYLHRCFTLYGLNQLTASEMKTIRHSIGCPDTQFQQQMNEWIDMCYFESDTHERLSFFTQNVLPAASDVQKEIDSIHLINGRCNSEEDLLQTEVWIGEIPVIKLWNYYKEQKVTKDKTWYELECLCEDDVYKNQRWPVMMLSIPEDQLQQLQFDDPEEEETEEEINEEPEKNSYKHEFPADILPAKKYFLID